MKHTEHSMQHALTHSGALFDWSRYAVVPNVSYGLLIRGEADLICITKAGVFHEVEIKVSRSDLRADLKKRRAHEDPSISFVWFAVPEELEKDALELLPERFGIVAVCEQPKRPGLTWTKVVRRPKKSEHCKGKPSQDTIIKLLRLGVMRMWTRGISQDALQGQIRKLVLENRRLESELAGKVVAAWEQVEEQRRIV